MGFKEKKKNPMDINSLTGTILDVCIKIHTKIGPGCFERVYEEVLYYELVKKNILIERQLLMPIVYDQLNIQDGFIGRKTIGNRNQIFGKACPGPFQAVNDLFEIVRPQKWITA